MQKGVAMFNILIKRDNHSWYVFAMPVSYQRCSDFCKKHIKNSKHFYTYAIKGYNDTNNSQFTGE